MEEEAFARVAFCWGGRIAPLDVEAQSGGRNARSNKKNCGWRGAAVMVIEDAVRIWNGEPQQNLPQESIGGEK
jgi:hypothetical protein